MSLLIGPDSLRRGLVGGALIGLSAILLLALNGRLAGMALADRIPSPKS